MFLYSKLSSLKIYRSCYCFFSINQQSGPQIYSKSKLCSYNQIKKSMVLTADSANTSASSGQIVANKKAHMAKVVLKEHLVLTLFRDEVDYQLYLLPSILEFEKLVKSGRAKQKYADLEYNVAKQVEKMIRHMKK
ncbi:uncharacterized protein LOC122012615 isoform X2 [Zingiber officinale]|uniref:uncharacterized protein LOC122012615 isoform X2 n=1 Tax=Zingiber officinale TaxID=94328 RepID=UPI001C4B65F7|nr:uncharacterized protein LOC122012615 isoform X2 [Zingiber officinale]